MANEGGSYCNLGLLVAMMRSEPDGMGCSAPTTGRWCTVDSTRTQNTLTLPRRAARATLPAAVVAVALFFLFVVTGINGLRGGWLWAILITTPAIMAVGWFGWGPHPARVPVTAAFAAAGIAFGLYMSQEAVLSAGRLRSDMDGIRVPSGFEKVGDQRNGMAICFDACTSFTRRWVAPGDAEEVRSTVTSIFEQQGFVFGPWRHGRLGGMDVRGHRGRLEANVSVSDWTWLPDGQRLTAPAGHIVVEVHLETYGGNPL